MLTDARVPGLRAQPSVAPEQGIRVTYFGTSGFLIEREPREPQGELDCEYKGEAQAILLAPFFSHYGYQYGFWKIGTKRDVVDRYLAPHQAGLRNVQAILVGHGHYDHLLDVPYIAGRAGYAGSTRQRMDRNASDPCPVFSVGVTVYGNDTVCNILNRGRRTDGDIKIPCVSLSKKAQRGQAANRGTWTYVNGGAIRFMAIRSGHAPNIDGQTAASGSTSAPLKRLPRKAGGWEMGETYAFMIDFMAADTADVEFRIFYQDAAYSPRSYYHVTPDSIDLAIVCVAVFDNAPGKKYPETLRDVLEPKQYLLSHWENFFMEYTQDLQSLHVVPLTDPVSFVDRLGIPGAPCTTWVMPIPGATLQY